ncbi:TetR family transcriptional regulator [Actinokineospora sp.]|uniref:TetR/AcrR family transcriptional regulator n=1 Tax=Actinokineospora sp. TaxID=1872133 RepID=UPI003D6A0FEA
MNVVTMAQPTDVAAGGPQRQRIIATAAALTTRSGWASVTMSRLADEVGVSRQTVYNEIGTKPALAKAMVLDELGRFLSVVDKAFDEHPEDLIAAITAAVRGVLELAEGNTLLHAIVSATHGADTELLPLLTTHAESLLSTAKAVVADRMRPFRLPFTAWEFDTAIDTVVRVVLSHVMQPSGSPEETAADIAWIARRVLFP